MPTFFFDVHDDLEVTDEEGCALPNVEAANAEAIVGARALASEQVSKGYLNLGHRIDVRDEGRNCPFSVNFAEVVNITREGNREAGAVIPQLQRRELAAEE